MKLAYLLVICLISTTFTGCVDDVDDAVSLAGCPDSDALNYTPGSTQSIDDPSVICIMESELEESDSLVRFLTKFGNPDMTVGEMTQKINQAREDYANKKNIGLEIMSTGAACWSYNLLIDEGRYVVACLFLTKKNWFLFDCNKSSPDFLVGTLMG